MSTVAGEIVLLDSRPQVPTVVLVPRDNYRLEMPLKAMLMLVGHRRGWRRCANLGTGKLSMLLPYL